MAQDFYSLQEMAPRFGVDADVFIKAWLDEKLPLYIHFGSDSPPCTIRRCIPRQLHEYARDDILYGRDLYQSKDSPDHDTLIFIPEHPLSAHLEVKAQYELEEGAGPGLGAYYEYRYRGSARGYWLAKPTSVTHLSQGRYLLTDKDSVGDVTVHALDIFDYLIFSKPAYILQLSLFARVNEVRELFPDVSDSVTEEKINLMGNIGDTSALTKKRPAKMFFALYLIIHEWCAKNKKGEPTLSNVVDYLKTVCDKSPELGTITRWAERPELESNIEKRWMPRQEIALYFLLRVYCEEKKSENHHWQ